MKSSSFLKLCVAAQLDKNKYQIYVETWKKTPQHSIVRSRIFRKEIC